jgi:hypothetical protein
MPTKKRVSRSTVTKAIASESKAAEKKLHKIGLNPRTLAAAVITIIGALMVIWGVSGLLEVFVGVVLIYFGIKMFGFNLHI